MGSLIKSLVVTLPQTSSSFASNFRCFHLKLPHKVVIPRLQLVNNGVVQKYKFLRIVYWTNRHALDQGMVETIATFSHYHRPVGIIITYWAYTQCAVIQGESYAERIAIKHHRFFV